MVHLLQTELLTLKEHINFVVYVHGKACMPSWKGGVLYCQKFWSLRTLNVEVCS